MDRSELYDRLAERKFKPKDLEKYHGGNGRVDKCAELIRRGYLHSAGILVDIGGGIGDLGSAVSDLFDSTIVVDISFEGCESE